MPVPDVKTQAPGLSAPDGVTPVVNNTFSKALASTAMGETATTITDVDGLSIACLLYTSDAADEEDSVDLGGPRIIKKKKRCEIAT